jgi:hypothetical protein
MIGTTMMHFYRNCKIHKKAETFSSLIPCIFVLVVKGGNNARHSRALCISCTREAEAGELQLQHFQGQVEIYSDTLSPKQDTSKGKR